MLQIDPFSILLVDLPPHDVGQLATGLGAVLGRVQAVARGLGVVHADVGCVAVRRVYCLRAIDAPRGVQEHARAPRRIFLSIAVVDVI